MHTKPTQLSIQTILNLPYKKRMIGNTKTAQFPITKITHFPIQNILDLPYETYITCMICNTKTTALQIYKHTKLVYINTYIIHTYMHACIHTHAYIHTYIHTGPWSGYLGERFMGHFMPLSRRSSWAAMTKRQLKGRPPERGQGKKTDKHPCLCVRAYVWMRKSLCMCI
jgi:hypothetical protein